MSNIEKTVTAPVEWGYHRVLQAGQFIMYALGQQKALDNLVAYQHRRTLSNIETDMAALALGKPTPADAESRAELAALHEFAELHGPTTHEQLHATQPTAPPEPFAVKQLERLLDKHLPSPDPGEPARQELP